MSDLRLQRQEKLTELRRLGKDPYPQPDLSLKQSSQEAQKMLNQDVLVAGRLMSIRGHGKILFADLCDRTGKIQLFFENQPDTKLLDIGDIISASGLVFKTQAGETTIKIKDFQILAK